ncbi:flavin reductase family protein [Paenibacillus campi]|uniref:flavin reductase family protein n=1 Tax=Paenibacillus campi TaxID=3106031 RepID=UPI002AFF8103|nr:flavin reductase family protein [Paenibacillus sp. SGZ-1014]
MITIDPQTISTLQNYKLVTGSVVPRPIAWVSTLTESGVINVAPFSYFNIVASDPPIVSVSVARREGQMKDTARNAIAGGELVIHIVSEHLTEEMNRTGSTLPPDQSELELTSLSTVPSDRIAVPGIREALVRFECKLEQHIPIKNDAGDVSNDLLLARIVCYHFDEKIVDTDKYYVHTDELKPVARIAGNEYARLTEPFVVERPL